MKNNDTVLAQLMELSTNELNDAMCEFFNTDNGWQANLLGDLLSENDEIALRYHDLMAQYLYNDVSENDLVEHYIIDGSPEYHKEKALKACEEFLESHCFSTTRYEEDGECVGIEFEDWTEGGVDMVNLLDGRDVDMSDADWWSAALSELVENFDVDAEIDLYRQDESYRQKFSIRESLDDIEAWKERLEELVP